MPDAIGPPRRKRLSWESRCEIVAKVRLQGTSPDVVAATSDVHRSSVYRPLARHDAGGWAALVDRRPVPVRQPRRLPEDIEARILNARAASGSGPCRLGAIPRPAGLDGRQGADPPRRPAPAPARAP